MSYLLYLHGFKSSPRSKKAQLTCDYLSKHAPHLEVLVPQLPPSPTEAIKLCEKLIADRGREELVGIVGSSLGGYYGMYLGARYEKKIVIINPAIKPYELLIEYVGENENFHTGEKFIVTEQHMQDLRSLEVEPYPCQSQVLLLTQTGDETLDYHQAVIKLRDAKMWIIPRGSHEFETFELVLPAIKSFVLPA